MPGPFNEPHPSPRPTLKPPASLTHSPDPALTTHARPPLQVATATTTVLLFISSTAATLSYIMERRLITSYAVAFAACSALGSLIGVFFIAGAVRRSGRGSVVTLLLAAAVGCGALLTAGLGGWDVAEEIKRHGAFGGFEYICR